MSRKLATIQTIKELLPIDSADAIELATFESIGWKCIVKKGEFKVGDKCVYFEIDSLLPNIPAFEFLAKGNKLISMEIDGRTVEGYRLRTVRLRGQLRGNFPSFIPKTDETRIQTCWDIVEKYKLLDFYAAIKYDGTSVTIFKCEGDFGVCSRNLDLKETQGNTYWEIANRYNLREKLPEGYAIQGEIYGEGLQGNPHKIQGIEFRVFNVYEIKEGRYLDLSDAKKFTENLELKFVEEWEMWNDGTLEGATMDDLLKMANDTGLEGLVFRPRREITDVKFGRVSFKVISNNYLLQNEL